MTFLKKIVKLILQRTFNNFVMNFFITKFKLERLIYKFSNPYLRFSIQSNKSIQENAGYSLRPEIDEVLLKSKLDLQTWSKNYLNDGASILDVGCGPGMYLALFQNSGLQLFATDINTEMINYSKQYIPNCKYYQGSFLDIKFLETYHFVYCIGVLVYIPLSDIKNFIQKLYSILKPNGILYLNYPHAISLLDYLYNDLTYIQYSPQRVEEWIAPYFTIIKHEHALDGRKVGTYDKQPYKSLNPNTTRTYKNSYLLIAQKK